MGTIFKLINQRCAIPLVSFVDQTDQTQ